MKSTDYLEALEIRLRWLRWMKSNRTQVDDLLVSVAQRRSDEFADLMGHIWNAGEWVLENAEATYWVIPQFCDLIRSVSSEFPDDLSFDNKWLQSRSGLLLFSNSGRHPNFLGVENYLTPAAIGWTCRDDLTALVLFVFGKHGEAKENTPFPLPFLQLPVRHGDKLSDVVAIQRDNRESMMCLADLTFTFTTLALMAQRLAVIDKHKGNRATRHRLEHEQVPFTPLVQVVTLRRLQHEPPPNHQPNLIDWQWQWLVHRHWRNQYCPSTGEHKWIVIETYVKGPEDKPLKPPAARVFVAKR